MWSVALTNSRYSAFVTSVFPIANPETVTGWAGNAAGSSSRPILNVPPGISTISGFAAVVVPGDVAGDGDAVFDKFPGGFTLPPKTPNMYAAPIPTTPSRNSTNNPAIPKIKGEKNDFFRGCEVTE